MESKDLLYQVISILIYIYILRLIHGHRLRVGHSWFLLLFGGGFLVLAFWPGAIDLVVFITGSNSLLDNILFYCVMFLFFIIVHCSLMIFDLTSRVKELAQEVTLLNSEIDTLKGET